MDDHEHLTEKQRRYVEHVAAGMDSRAAALKAGYSPSFAKVAAHRLGKKLAVAQAIASIRSEGRTMAVYDLATAMREADDVCAFAKQHKNAMAYCKATELRAKLSGLLIERVEVVSVDLSGSLARAAHRVLQHNPALTQLLQAEAQADQPAGDNFRYCGPGEKGNPFGTD